MYDMLCMQYIAYCNITAELAIIHVNWQYPVYDGAVVLCYIISEAPVLSILNSPHSNVLKYSEPGKPSQRLMSQLYISFAQISECSVLRLYM
jgi:hypothetical protein